MRSKSGSIFRWAVVILTLAFLLAIPAACGDSSPDESTPDSAPSVVSPAPVSQRTQTGPTAAASTEATVPAASPLPVTASETSVENNRDRLPVIRSEPTATYNGEGAQPQANDSTGDNLLAAFEESLNGIYETVVPSVVYIRVPNAAGESLRGVPGIPEGLLWGAGSGFVWNEQGHIVTNHHVVEGVADGSEQVTVIFADSTQAKGRVVGADPHSDLAVIELEDGDWDLTPVALGDSSAVKVGQLAVAIGAPFGQEFTMTSGIVSAVGRNISGQSQFTIPEVIQTDAAINPGNSGGPLLDRKGRVIGINTQIISRSGNFSGVGMAVPVNIAMRVVPSLIEDGEFNYPWLGVSIATVTDAYAMETGLPEETTGALIITVVEDSPADKAGLRGSESTVELDGAEYPSGGDIILAVNDYVVNSSNELISHLTYHNSPGDTVSLTVLSDGQREEVGVTLGKRPTTP